MLDQAEGGNGPPELLAFEGVLCADLEQLLRGPDGSDPQLQTTQIEDVERDVRALAHFAQKILDRHLNVLEDEAAGRGGFNAQFVFFLAGGKTGRRPLDQKGGGVLAVNLGENREQIRPRGIRDRHPTRHEQQNQSEQSKRGHAKPAHAFLPLHQILKLAL